MEQLAKIIRDNFNRIIDGKVIAWTYQTTNEIIAIVQEIMLIKWRGENCGILRYFREYEIHATCLS